MAQVAWTEQALSDLESVCLFIARDSPRMAELFADRAFRVVDRLASFPHSGRVVPEVGREDIREIISQGYRIIYRITAEEVDILTIHHGSRPVGGVDE